jgi:hypothetical protein
MIKHKILLILLVVLLSCEKEDESNKCRVIFFTSDNALTVTGTFGRVDVQFVSVAPKCDTPDEYLRIVSYDLLPGKYIVRFYNRSGVLLGTGSFTARGDCLPLDCARRLQWV